MSRANTDLQQIQSFVVMIPLTMSNLGTVLAVVVLLLTIDPLLALLALAPLPLVNVLAQRFSRRIHPAVLGVQAEPAELATVVEETVSGVRVSRASAPRTCRPAKLRVEADDVYARLARGGPDPRRVPAGARPAAQPRPDRRARHRRPPGDRRRADLGAAGGSSTRTSPC